MTHFVGIDLGTTFSALSVLDETGRPKIIHNKDGQNITPSCVTEIDGEYVVGEEARKTWCSDPESGEAAARFKRDIETDKIYNINGKNFTPTELSALVLKKLAQDAMAQIGEIGEAVVTVPANFGNSAREATMSAAKKAGLNVRFIINEPTAAALYYAFKEANEMNGVYAVYDLGGGTFDISIIRVSGYNVEVMATNGIRHLGGDDFDRALRKIVGKKYQQQSGESMEISDYDFNGAEEDKKSLSNRQKIRAKVNRELIEITRGEFEEAISSMITQAEMMCAETMEEAKLAPSDIREVLLAGGSTRIPMVKESVKRVFGKEPVFRANVDEVVSMGAILYAAYKGDQSQLSALQKQSVQQIEFKERTAKYYGTLCIGSDEERQRTVKKNDILIKKNTALPCSATQSYYTIVDGQEHILCDVTESAIDDPDPNYADIQWAEEMELPPNRPAGREIKVTFTYNINQIMECVFEDVESGRTKKASLSMVQAKDDDGHGIEEFIVE